MSSKLWAGIWTTRHCQRELYHKEQGGNTHSMDLRSAGLWRGQPLALERQTATQLGCRSREDLKEFGKGRKAKSKAVVKSPLWIMHATTDFLASEMHWGLQATGS